MNDFFGAVKERQERIKSLLCVGLDPDLEKIPRAYRKQNRPILQFCLATGRSLEGGNEDLASVEVKMLSLEGHS